MRTKLTMFLAGALLFVVPSAIARTPVPVGSEFLVNTYTTDHQWFGEIAMTPAGDFVVVWESNGSSNDMSLSSVQGQRFAADASPIGSQFQINTYTTGAQRYPAIALTPAGEFIVVWQSDGSAGDDTSADSIQGQRLAADASPIGSQFQINTYTTGAQQRPAVEAAPDGDFVVVWGSNGSPGDDSSLSSIQGQRFTADASPTGAQFQINTYTSDYQFTPALAVDSAGDFVVVWTSVCCIDTAPFTWSIESQRFAADGSPIGVEFQVNTETTGSQFGPALEMSSAGDFLVVWGGESSSGDTFVDVQGQRFAADASPIGAQFRINTYTTSAQRFPAVAGLPAGDFVVVWQSYGSADDNFFFSIQGQRFDPEASPIGVEFQVNTYTTNDQERPVVALDPTGDFVVLWRSLGSNNGDTSSWSIQGQRFKVSIFTDGFESGDTTAWSTTVAYSDPN